MADSTSLGKLSFELVMGTDGLIKSTQITEQSLEKVNKATEKTTKEAGKMSSALKVGFAGAGVAAAGYAAAILALTTKQMDLIRSQDTLARSLNSTVTGIKAVNAAAADKGIEGMEGSLARLQRRLGAVENGGGPAAGAVKALGLSTRELASADADKKIQMIAQAIQSSGVNAAQAARYVQDLGFEQKGVLELFKDGGRSIADQRTAIEGMGRAVSQIDAAKITIAKQQIDGMADSFDALKTQLAIQLAPILGAMAKAFNDFAANGVDASNRVSSALNTTVTVVGYAADAIEGLRVTGQLAGTVMAQAIYAARIGFLEAGQAIINGPVNAMNSLIDLSNRFLGTDFSKFAPNVDWAEEIKAGYDVMAVFGAELDEIANGFERPSEALREFVDTAVDEYNRLAEERVAADAKANEAIEAAQALNYQSIAKDAQFRLDMAKATGAAETDIYVMELQGRQTALAEALSNEEITEREFMQQSELAWAQYNQNLKNLDDTYNQQKLSGAKQIFGSLSTLMNTESRKLFEIGKVAAYSNTVVTTAEAAMSAYKAMAGIPIVGPALGAAAAGAAVIAGGVQLATIANTKFGSGSAPTQVPTSAINAATEPVGAAAQAPQQDIYIRGLERDSLYSGEQVLDLVNEAINSGGRLAGIG